MDYSPTLCFVGFNSKIRKFQQKRKKKSNCSILCCDRFCVLRQMSKQMAKEIYHDNISFVSTQRTEYRRGAISRQKTAFHDRTWEECNKSAKAKKYNVATRFVSWMSTLGRTCRYIKAHVTTLETKESRNFVTTRYLMSRQEIKEQYRKNIATYQFMLRHNEK